MQATEWSLLTTVTVAVTTAFTLLVTQSIDASLVTGVAAALAGADAVLTDRWILMPGKHDQEGSMLLRS